jgi:hypothetical protein
MSKYATFWPREARNKPILDLSALVTAKRGFPVNYKISNLQITDLAGASLHRVNRE